jgi:hypothetical protein
MYHQRLPSRSAPRDHFRSAGKRLFALIFGKGTESSVTFFHDITRGVEQAAAAIDIRTIFDCRKSTDARDIVRGL